jgi:hypothetical protein
MFPILYALATVAAFCAAIAVSYAIVAWMNRIWLASRYRRCPSCYLLHQLPFGGPGWLIRRHERRVAQEDPARLVKAGHPHSA